MAVSVAAQDIAGYYTLAATSVALGAFSPEIVKKLPRYPVAPAVLLGRLAVARQYQDQGLGGILLADALRAQAAQGFYEHHGFTLLPGEARRLCLPMATAQKVLFGKPGH